MSEKPLFSAMEFKVFESSFFFSFQYSKCIIPLSSGLHRFHREGHANSYFSPLFFYSDCFQDFFSLSLVLSNSVIMSLSLIFSMFLSSRFLELLGSYRFIIFLKFGKKFSHYFLNIFPIPLFLSFGDSH